MFAHVWSDMCKFGNKCANRLCSFQHIEKEPPKENINKLEINNSVAHQDENTAWCEVCEMEYDDMIGLEIHERRFHETSDEQKCDSCDYKVENEAQKISSVIG